MTKKQFIDILKEELNRNNVPDSDDIAKEYEQHFLFKLADGYSEEEISATRKVWQINMILHRPSKAQVKNL